MKITPNLLAIEPDITRLTWLRDDNLGQYFRSVTPYGRPFHAVTVFCLLFILSFYCLVVLVLAKCVTQRSMRQRRETRSQTVRPLPTYVARPREGIRTRVSIAHCYLLPVEIVGVLNNCSLAGVAGTETWNNDKFDDKCMKKFHITSLSLKQKGDNHKIEYASLYNTVTKSSFKANFFVKSIAHQKKGEVILITKEAVSRNAILLLLLSRHAI